MNFEDFNLTTPLLNALIDLEYINPTPIQEKTFSPIMSGKDIVGVAQTGTGKTFAYLLPLLRMLKFSDKKHPSILIVVPTRELVLQIVGEIEKLTKYMNVRYTGVYGGANIAVQKQTVYNGLDILVATPGRLYDLTMSGILRLKSIRKFVIDEVDEMLNLGFRAQVANFMELLPEKRQNLMFSATLTNDVENIINEFFFEPEKIEIAKHGTPLEQIKQSVYHVPNFYTKINLLNYLIKKDESMHKVLVFTASKKLADRLHENLTAKGSEINFEIGVIHSNKSQNYRIRMVESFRASELRMLIATDIIARGLDIRNVSHVINFDTPKLPGDYIHRIGRTGRADKQGIAITFVNQAEQEFQISIEKLMKKNIEIVPLPEDLAISDIFTEEELPTNLHDKNYLKVASIKNSKGAFHEKKEKNIRQNSGSPSKKRKAYTKSGKKIK